MITYNY
jgi:hypothetical protein